jgi:energy-coupling factor transporter transmembrane protein EcfT
VNASANTELKIEEFPGELRFRFDRQASGTTQLVIFVIVILIFIGALTPIFTISPLIFALSMVIVLAFAAWIGMHIVKNWNKTLTTTLSVTSQRFEATGDSVKSDWLGHQTRPGNAAALVSEIKSFGYEMGSEDTPSGFWVRCGLFKNFCALPGLKREQCIAVSVAIAKRFPEIGANMQRQR